MNDIFPATKVIIGCEKNVSIFITDVRSLRNNPYCWLSALRDTLSCFKYLRGDKATDEASRSLSIISWSCSLEYVNSVRSADITTPGLMGGGHHSKWVPIYVTNLANAIICIQMPECYSVTWFHRNVRLRRISWFAITPNRLRADWVGRKQMTLKRMSYPCGVVREQLPKPKQLLQELSWSFHSLPLLAPIENLLECNHWNKKNIKSYFHQT